MEEKPKRNYGLLKEKNPDFAGWLRIPDTKIDYPVMHTPDDMQYYIRRDFYGESSVSGTPFIGDFCSTDSGSMIIYAHNMKNGTLFGELDEYESEDYRKSIQFWSFIRLMRAASMKFLPHSGPSWCMKIRRVFAIMSTWGI